MISLNVPEEELINRLLLRAKTSGRTDDTLDVIKVRLKEYEDKTKPVAKFYAEKNKYFPINGVGEIDDIFENILKVIDMAREEVKTNIVLLGKPGSGKGTQGKLLAKEFGLAYISTGKLMRREIAEGTKIGKLAKPYMDKGEIVPDEIPIQLIEREIKNNPGAKGFVFKGFPRTIVQAYILDGLLERENMAVSSLIEMKVSTLEAIRRLSARSKTDSARPYDASTEMIINRLEQYKEKTVPVIDYYKNQGKYKSVKAEATEEEVFDLLKKQVGDIIESNY